MEPCGKDSYAARTEALHILLMEYTISKIVGLRSVQRQPRVLKRRAVGKNGFPIRILNDDGLWNKVNDVNDSQQLFSLS